MVKSALDGKNVCIFAYGQTGSGKTYTMQGDEGSTIDSENSGIVPRAVQMIFNSLAERKRLFGSQLTFSVMMSCFEIYIETAKDLLDVSNSQSMATNLSKWKPISLEVTSLDDVQILLKKTVKNRSMGATALNEYSSRSHCIHKLNISVRENNEQIVSGNLVLIDLAGSERINDSRVDGQRK